MQIEKTIKIDISDKDIEIVRLIAEGETRAVIAAKMNISIRTIEPKLYKLRELFGAVCCGNLISHTIRGKKNDNLIQGNSVSIQVNGFTAVASEMTFSPVQTS